MIFVRMNHPAARRAMHDAKRPGLSPKGDPTATMDIRSRYASLVTIRWNKLRAQLRDAIVTQDMLGLDGNKQTSLSIALRALPMEGKVRAFQGWLDNTLQRVTLANDTTYLDPMISQAYARAVARGMKLTNSKASPPGAADAVGALQQLTMTEMQGINEAVSQRIVRQATYALMNNSSPKDLFLEASNAVNQIGVTRSRALVETMVAKAHSTGTLDQFAAAGVQRVGLIPESKRKPPIQFKVDAPAGTGPGSRISREVQPSARTVRRIAQAQKKVEALGEVDIVTAGDEVVCQECQDLEDEGPYSIDEARSLIPAHPWCRCAFVPTGNLDWRDYNPNHAPGGSPDGGQFIEGEGGGGGLPLANHPLSGEGKQTLKEYAGQDFRYANSVARGQEDRLGRPQKEIGRSLKDRMDKMFANVRPTSEDLLLYRGMHLYPTDELYDRTRKPADLVGTVIEDKGWTSTTRDFAEAKAFATATKAGWAPVDPKNIVLMAIKTKPGIKAIDVAAHVSTPQAKKEKEVLLDRGSKFTVTGHHYSGKYLVLDMSHGT